MNIVREIFAVVVDAGLKVQMGSVVLDGDHAHAGSRDEAQVQVLKAVKLVVVESGDEQARREIAIVRPPAPHRAGDLARKSIDARRAVNLVEVQTDLVLGRSEEHTSELQSRLHL